MSDFQPWARNKTTLAASDKSSGSHTGGCYYPAVEINGQYLWGLDSGHVPNLHKSMRHPEEGQEKKNWDAKVPIIFVNYCQCSSSRTAERIQGTARTVSDLPKLFIRCHLFAAWTLTWNSQSRFESHFWFWINKNDFSMTHWAYFESCYGTWLINPLGIFLHSL